MIILPLGLTAEEIRVLQEFRRLGVETLAIDTIKGLKHPTGLADETPALSLVAKSWLSADEGRTNFTLTEKARDFLAIDAKPMFEEGPSSGQPVPAAAGAASAAGV